MQVPNLRKSFLPCDRSKKIPRRSFSRIQIRPEETVNVFGIYLTSQMKELVLITHVFQYQNILRVQRDIATVPPLMNEVPGNQNNSDVAVIAAFRK